MSADKAVRRRRHFRAEQLTCRQLIDEMLATGRTYDEIVAAVQEAGEGIGRSSIARYADQVNRMADKMKRAREQAAVLIEQVRSSGPGTELNEVANAIMVQGLVQRLVETDEEEWAKLPLDKVGKIAADLERAATGRERLKADVRNKLEAAGKGIKEQLRKELASRPDLLAQMEQMIDSQIQQAAQE